MHASDSANLVPEPVVDLCRSLSDFVHQAIGYRPDYTPETLPFVDHYLNEARRTLDGRPEIVDLMAQAAGAYFGEVVRRTLTGFWRVPTPNFHDWQLCGEAAYFAFNPIGIGYEIVTRGGEHSGPSSAVRLSAEDVELVRARLLALPEEREEAYYTLSTRYEFLEIVAEAVRAQAENRGYTEMMYSDEDYGVGLRPL